MKPLVNYALDIEPGEYDNYSQEYQLLDSLTEEDFSEYLDNLAADQRTCTYRNEDDTFIVT